MVASSICGILGATALEMLIYTNKKQDSLFIYNLNYK